MADASDPKPDATASASDLLTGMESERRGGWRETIESFAIAFILAFVFKTFEAEAFVIPTGSMAPTLHGRHKDVECQKCGHEYTVGASDELEEDWLQPVYRIDSAYCPNCRFENDVRDLPVFKGDRILVNKFPYEFGEPSRWDVAVFKYPEEPNTNYIKRLVGLPGETLVIRRGDLYRELPDRSREILRKDDPEKQNVLQILVHDNEHPEIELHQRGWPRRWAAVRHDLDDPRAVAGWVETSDGWAEFDDGRGFRLPAGDKPAWLRYRHFVPRPEIWAATGPVSDPRPRLITDFCGYNAYEGGRASGRDRDYYWVGDLTLDCRVTIGEVRDQARLVLELVEGRRRFRAVLGLAGGTVRVTSRIDLNRGEDEEELLGQAQGIRLDTGPHDFRFANVDDRLCLWVDDNLVELGSRVVYRRDATEFPGPGFDDLSPVGIAATGAELTVDRLVLHRDIYYRSEKVRDPNTRQANPSSRNESTDEPELLASVDDPGTWQELYAKTFREAVFQMGPDEFLMLGDNSPKSKDGRLWGNTRAAEHRHAVPRSALVGKAFYIYWPHGVPFMNDGRGFPDDGNSILHKIPVMNRWFFHAEPSVEAGRTKLTDYPNVRIPFYPQFSRMRRIR